MPSACAAPVFLTSIEIRAKKSNALLKAEGISTYEININKDRLRHKDKGEGRGKNKKEKIKRKKEKDKGQRITDGNIKY